jgi:glycosyltransferase involved in cell wall biosynthesis
VGGLAEVVPDGKTGFVAEPEPKALADAILKFFQPGAIPDLKQNIQTEKQKYSWNTFIEQLMQTAFKVS